MVSSSSVPWYNRPAREYPIKRWLRLRYPFVVSPAVLSRPGQVSPALAGSARRPFPARRWQEQRAASLCLTMRG